MTAAFVDPDDPSDEPGEMGHDGTTNEPAAAFVQCESRLPTVVFSHYAYGDPLPVYARYVGEDGPVAEPEAITVYVRCEREAGHIGKHLSTSRTGWTDADAA